MDKKLISIEKTDKTHTLKKVLVNSITAIRALGTLVIVPIFKNNGPFTAGLAAAGFFLTDFIDGKLARGLKVQTFFGSLLDSLSDKAFAIICLVLLALQNPIFWTVIAAEGAIVYANYKSAQKGNNIQSSFAGKAKTACMLVGVSLLFLHDLPFSLFNFHPAKAIIMVATVLSVISGIQYYVKNKKSNERIVIDYISGFTDNFFEREYEIYK